MKKTFFHTCLCLFFAGINSFCLGQIQPMGFTQEIVTPSSDRFQHAYRPKLKLLDDTLYVCTNTGIYRKSLRHDSGWELYAFDKIPIIEFVRNGNRLLAISPGTKDGRDSLMFLSEDNGRTFRNYTTPHFFEEETFNYPNRIVQNPQNPDAILLYHTFYGLSKSGDFGASWKNLNNIGGVQNWFAAFHPLDTTNLFYTGETGYFAGFMCRSTNSGLTWHTWNNPPYYIHSPFYIHPGGDNCIHHIAFHPTDPNVLVYSGEMTMGKSADKGETWDTVDLHDSGMYFYKVLFDEDNPTTLYASGVSRKHSDINDSIWVYRSTDAGNSWHLACRESTGMDCGGVTDMVKYENRLIFYTYKGGLFELNLNTIPQSNHTLDRKPDVSIYPNPVQNTLHFSTEATIKHIEIINTTGQAVQKTTIPGNERTVDVSHISNGIYLAVFYPANGKRIVKKIYIAHF
jgi:hypothetical protein